MHIGLVSPGWPADEFPNGIVTYVANLRAALLVEGHKITVFANAVGKGGNYPGVCLVAPSLMRRAVRSAAGLFSSSPDNFSWWGSVLASRINEVHRHVPLDIVEMEESFGWCAEVQRLVDVPVVVKLHGPAFLSLVEEELDTERARLRIRIEGEALHRVQALTSPSLDTLQQTRARYHIEPSICDVVPNPMSMGEDAGQWSMESCDGKLILFVGRFDKRKGGDTALQAFRKLLDADASLKLAFVGPDAGLTTTGGNRLHFDEFCSSLFSDSEKHNISYLGHQPGGRIAELRRRAAVTLVLSRWENQPNTALEAMLQGCPIVAVDSGGMSEIIQNEATGLLARGGDIDHLCMQIMRCLNDRVSAARMGGCARAFVIERHDIAGLVAKTLDVYRRAIAARRTNFARGVPARFPR